MRVWASFGLLDGTEPEQMCVRLVGLEFEAWGGPMGFMGRAESRVAIRPMGRLAAPGLVFMCCAEMRRKTW